MEQHEFEPDSGPMEGAEPVGRKRGTVFALLYLPRTGSNMLKEWLSTHDTVRCLPAIFSTESGWPSADPGGRGTLRWMRDNIPATWDDAELRREKPRKLLRQIMAKSPDKRVLGFKHQLTADAFTDQILGNGVWLRKVLLVRENLLAAYSSAKVAHATGQGTARKGDEIRRAPVAFDPDEFTKFAEKRRQAYMRARQNARRPCLEIEYMVARTLGGIAKIGRFLDLDPSGFGSQTTAKRNSDDIVSRFSDRDLVQAYLKENQLEHWAREG